MIGCGQARIAFTPRLMAGEVEQLRGLHLGERLDDLEHVAPSRNCRRRR